PSPPLLPGLDWSVGLRHMGGNPELLLKQLVNFHQDHGGDAGRIRQALAAGDLEHARRIAHTLKGIAGTIGATTLQQAAQELDGMLKTRQPDDPAGCLERLEEAMEPVMRGLATLRSAPVGAPGRTAAPDPSTLVALRDRLTVLLQELDPHAEALAHELQRLAEGGPLEEHTRLLARQVADFEFEQALATLASMDRGAIMGDR
ncbi:MAG: Hpt domain-containing protein, partial [Magnetococcales bacterium]|nr:Hpt domain-containing protein [Magnetococcales bacterium]